MVPGIASDITGPANLMVAIELALDDYDDRWSCGKSDGSITNREIEDESVAGGALPGLDATGSGVGRSGSSSTFLSRHYSPAVGPCAAR